MRFQQDLEYKYIVNENLVLGGSITSSESEFDAGSVGYANDPTYTGMTAATRDVSGDPINDAVETSWTFYLDHTVPSMQAVKDIQGITSTIEVKEIMASIQILKLASFILLTFTLVGDQETDNGMQMFL